MGLNGLGLRFQGRVRAIRAVAVHLLKSGLVFFFLDICFDVSVDVDLDNNRLHSKYIVKQCLLSAPLYLYLILLHFPTLLSAFALPRSP